jgi:hypothetical protein
MQQQHQGLYYVTGGGNNQAKENVIIEADEESYYQNDSPIRGAQGPLSQMQNNNNRRLTQGAPDSRSGLSNSPPPTNNATKIMNQYKPAT